MDGYTVGEVARLARISVRTLHHYDGIEPGFSQYVHDAMYANAARGQARSQAEAG